MYESPIKLFFPSLEEELCNIAKKQDDMVFDAVAKVGVTVDKEELLRALRYDRDQYNRGFNDGIIAAADELVRCKDCKHYKPGKYFKDINFCHRLPYYAEKGGLNVADDDFCSYGERRSND